jgi:hypothetical protein
VKNGEYKKRKRRHKNKDMDNIEEYNRRIRTVASEVIERVYGENLKKRRHQLLEGLENSKTTNDFLEYIQRYVNFN